MHVDNITNVKKKKKTDQMKSRGKKKIIEKKVHHFL